MCTNDFSVDDNNRDNASEIIELVWPRTFLPLRSLGDEVGRYILS